MQTYVVIRRHGWRTQEELEAAVEAGTSATEQMADRMAWVRSYALTEADGTIGAVCVYQAESEDDVREHDRIAGLPSDAVVLVAGTMVAAPDPEPVFAVA